MLAFLIKGVVLAPPHPLAEVSLYVTGTQELSERKQVLLCSPAHSTVMSTAVHLSKEGSGFEPSPQRTEDLGVPRAESINGANSDSAVT